MLSFYRVGECVEHILRELEGYVPKGDIVQFELCDSEGSKITFEAVQTFDAGNRQRPETENEKLTDRVYGTK